jgi:hypothetical protein
MITNIITTLRRQNKICILILEGVDILPIINKLQRIPPTIADIPIDSWLNLFVIPKERKHPNPITIITIPNG